MKIFGICAGRPEGNSEYLLKAALEACEKEYGAEVAWVNLHEHPVNPCIGCEKCIMELFSKKVMPKCIYHDKDDLSAIMEEYLASDGIIFCVPSFFQQIPGVVKQFTDRWLPYEMGNLKRLGVIDEIPHRVVGILTVGGSSETWMGFSLEQIHAILTSQSVKVVDKRIITRNNRPGQILIHEDKMEAARDVGRNVAKSCLTEWDRVEYLGDRSETMCPVCFSNMIRKGQPHWDGLSFKYECTVCGTGGDIEAGEDGYVKFVPAANGLEHCRIFTEGRDNHMEEVMSSHVEAEENAELIRRKKAEANNYRPRKL